MAAQNKHFLYPSLLSAVTATGAGATQTLRTTEKAISKIRYWVKAASVATGGTVLIQGSYDGTNWATLATVAVSANGVTSAVLDGPLTYLRANLSVRTDGTYTVDAEVIEAA